MTATLPENRAAEIPQARRRRIAGNAHWIGLAVLFAAVALIAAWGLVEGYREVVVLTAGAVVGLTGCILFSRWIPYAFAFVLGGFPFMQFPGLPLPVVFILGAAVYVAAFLIPHAVSAISGLEVAYSAFVALSIVSAVATNSHALDITTLIRWVFAAAIVIPLVRLPRDVFLLTVRWFGIGVTAGAAIAILSFQDLGGDKIMARMGYRVTDETTRYFVENGQRGAVRLAGTYIEPNIAGLFLVIGLIAVVYTFRTSFAVLCAAIIGTAIALTLSRSAMFTVIAGLLLLLVLSKLPVGARILAFGTMAVGLLVLLSDDTIARRLLDTGSAQDSGAFERMNAYERFTGYMDGHWIFGVGWGRPEFFSQEWGYTVNFVANTPLLTFYRGGLLVFLAFVAVILGGLVLSFRMLRADSFRLAAVGAGFAALNGIAIQLDFPIVIVPMVTLVYSFLVAILIQAARDPAMKARTSNPTDDPEKRGTSTTQGVA
ncbi:O-antigen ligase family protein [Gordonia alkaliphila]|uniref:O-antigen ligase family protein n=1 Tax=Gordonia alkaliphila TaxID=1053547 RepID=UPI001FF5DC63|nr:O-antigen ligase family protein [Gordonia alkaliphila]MCK0438072.1 O-antigen ligase family protein [Gordonia alkaliphila]